MLCHIGHVLRFGGVLSLSLLATTAVAQVKLEAKFEDGRKTVVHTTMKLKQTLTLAGMAQETESDRFVITSSQAGKRDADGKLRIESKTDKLSVNMKIQGITVSFDSDDPNKKAENPLLEPLLQTLRVAAKIKATLIRDQSGKVIAVEGFDKAAGEVPAELRGDFNVDQVKKNANQELDFLPTEAVKIGDTWTKTTDLPLGGGQTMSLTTDYKYVGEAKEGDKTFNKIESKTTAVSLAIAENPNAQVKIRLTKSDLKPVDSTGTLLFDREAGQVHSLKGKLRVVGDLELEVNGTSYPGKLDLTIESETVRQP